MYRKLFYSIFFIVMLSFTGHASANLVAYWPFNEGSGEMAFDMSGNGNHATVSENVVWVEGQLISAVERMR